jgi:hypothetical protein
MSGYTHAIVTETGCTYKDAEEIEELMRLTTGGALDHLSKNAFGAKAREAEAALEILREGESWTS